MTSWRLWRSLWACEAQAAPIPSSCFPTNELRRSTSPSLSLTLSHSLTVTGGHWKDIFPFIMNVTHRTNTEVVWRTISDFQKDPYTTGLSIFSKITDKILFRWLLLPDILWKGNRFQWINLTFSPVEERRPEEEMAELLQVQNNNIEWSCWCWCWCQSCWCLNSSLKPSRFIGKWVNWWIFSVGNRHLAHATKLVLNQTLFSPSSRGTCQLAFTCRRYK